MEAQKPDSQAQDGREGCSNPRLRKENNAAQHATTTTPTTMLFSNDSGNLLKEYDFRNSDSGSRATYERRSRIGLSMQYEPRCTSNESRNSDISTSANHGQSEPIGQWRGTGPSKDNREGNRKFGGNRDPRELCTGIYTRNRNSNSSFTVDRGLSDFPEQPGRISQQQHKPGNPNSGGTSSALMFKCHSFYFSG